MKLLLITLLLLLLTTTAGFAQQTQPERIAAQADSLRALATCPAQVEWPSLPEKGFRTFHSVISDSRGTGYPPDSAVLARLARPDVIVPQYAFFHDPRTRTCQPVIIVQAEGKALGWISLDYRRGGGAWDVFFDLLGREQPRGKQ
jgi:hypothetical protein